MYAFITLRALSASPLMMGGDLPSLDDFSLELITNKDVIECNQNGIMGSLIYEKEGVEKWKTPKRDSNGGWIGIFNRTKSNKSLIIKKDDLKLDHQEEYVIYDIWANKEVDNLYFKINTNGVVFLKYYPQTKL